MRTNRVGATHDPICNTAVRPTCSSSRPELPARVALSMNIVSGIAFGGLRVWRRCRRLSTTGGISSMTCTDVPRSAIGKGRTAALVAEYTGAATSGTKAGP